MNRSSAESYHIIREQKLAHKKKYIECGIARRREGQDEFGIQGISELFLHFSNFIYSPVIDLVIFSNRMCSSK